MHAHAAVSIITLKRGTMDGSLLLLLQLALSVATMLHPTRG
jgi:hypothetical protein